MFIQKMTKEASHANEGTMYVYTTLYDEYDGPKRHEFSLTKAKQGKSNHPRHGKLTVDYVTINEVVDDKMFDCFVAFKKHLPQGIHPLYTGKKWKNIATNGPLASVSRPDAEGRLRPNKGATEVCNYRNNALYVKEVQSATGENTKEMKFYKKMKWKDWYFAEEYSTETEVQGSRQSVLTDDDSILLDLLFKPADDFVVKTTISKSEDGGAFTVDSVWNDKENYVAKGKLSGAIRVGLPIIPQGEDNAGQPDKKKAYKFMAKDGNKKLAYKAEVKITTGGKTHKYIYVLDYNDETEHEVELQSVNEGSSTSDIFGVPTSYPSFLENLRVEKIDLEDLSF